MRILLLIIFVGSIFPSCHHDNKEVKNQIVLNDSTRALAAVFNDNFLSRYLPDYSGVSKGQSSIFGDSILLEYNDSLDYYIPEAFDKFILKRIHRDSFCSILKTIYSDTVEHFRYLTVKKFERVDSIYSISIEVGCVFVDYFGDKIELAKPCIFGLLCGGGMNAEVKINEDSITLVKKGSWSY